LTLELGFSAKEITSLKREGKKGEREERKKKLKVEIDLPSPPP
jgi:hypothetical protein